MNKIQFYKSLNQRGYYYLRGTIFPIVGDFAAFKYSGTSATLTKNSDHLLLTLSSAQGWIYDTTPVDLTNINKIWVYGSSSTTAGCIVSIYNEYNSIPSSASGYLPQSNADGWVSIDVSALTGSYYIRIGRTGSATSFTARVFELYGEK